MKPREHGLALNKDGQRRSAFELLAYPEIGWTEIRGIWPELSAIDPAIAVHLEIDAKYDVYLKRQIADVDAFRRDEGLILGDIDYSAVPGLSNEARAKLEAARPRTVGQAGRLDGMTPAALGILAAYLRREARRKTTPRSRKLFHVKQGPMDPMADPSKQIASPSGASTRPRRWRSRLFHVKQRRGSIAISTCSGNGRPRPIWSRHRRCRISGPGISPIRCSSWTLAPSAKVWVDLGSGGGFPGVVLACALAETPGAMVHLVERNAKKAAFLREALRVTGAPGTVHLADIGDTVDRIAGPGRLRHRPRGGSATSTHRLRGTAGEDEVRKPCFSRAKM